MDVEGVRRRDCKRLLEELLALGAENWRGRPLRTFEAVVQLIGRTRTAKGLRVRAKLDERKYPLGVAVPKAVMASLALHPHDFHGDWNYELRPRGAELIG